MKIRKGFVVREVAGEIIAVPTGELVKDFQEIITLTKSAKFVWDLLQEDRTIEDIKSKLVEKYKIDEERAQKDIEQFIENLREANVIEE